MSSPSRRLRGLSATRWRRFHLRWSTYRSVVTVSVGFVMLVACTQKMAVQPYNRPYTPSDVFADGSSARPIPADTVARGHTEDDTLLFTGKDGSGQDSTSFPFPITREVLQRGFNPPPSYNSDALRQAPVGHFFDVVTNGFGAMPSYAAQLPVEDRWAIVAYIRALQLSQHATVDDAPPDAQAQLEGQP